MDNRNEINNNSLILDDGPAAVAGVSVRPVTLFTMAVLAQVGNRVLEGDDYDMCDMMVFLWVHAAPVEQVIKLSSVKEFARTRVYEEACRWAAAITPDKLNELGAHVQAEMERLAAARPEVIPNNAGEEKNAPGPSASQH